MGEARSTTAGDWLSPVLELEDRIGVLSVYLDADPALAVGSPPAWQAPVRAGLRDLLKHAQLEWPRDDRMAFEARLEELEPELSSLLERRDPGRGRALFAAIEGGDVRRIEVHALLPSAVAVAPRAVVLPLVAVRQAGRPAGVAEISWARAAVSEWELGTVREVETIEFDVDQGGDPRPATNPAVPQPFPERDRFETGVGSRVLARVREVGSTLRREAEERGWDAVVVDGDPRFLEALQAGFGSGGPTLLPSPQPLAGVSSRDAADRVAAALLDRRQAQERLLVGQLDESAAATRDRAVVERALAEGRVEHLLLEPTQRPVDAPAESLLRRALETSAQVTIVETAPGALGPDGVAALLRW